MSELIQTNDNRATIRWKLLTGASALVLTAYVSATNVARAEDADRSTLWIELGGQMEMMQGLGSSFVAPFMSTSTQAGFYAGNTLLQAISPDSDPYRGNIFLDGQKPPRYALGLDGKISFQPQDSDWIFSAGIRYGRSHAKRHIHHQTDQATVTKTVYLGYPFYFDYQVTRHPSPDAAADITMPFEERHAIVDLQVGKDVGLGLLGREGTSSINVGVRFAQFQTKSSLDVRAIPKVDMDMLYGKYGIPFLETNFRGYTMHAHAARSFKGVGPSLSWNASAVVAGTPQDSELTIDWGINAALLFGRQKAKTDHSSGGYHSFYTASGKYISQHRTTLTPHSAHRTSSRSVTVPNVGGFAGISLKWPNAKLSVGYRADVFLNAMDTGIDTAKKSNLTFNGPYASISIGLGD